MIIKVCGLRDPVNAKNVAAIQGVSLIGMIFYPKSPRFVAPGPETTELAALNQAVKVGVFVNEIPEEIVRKCELYKLDFLQLHGKETPGYMEELKKHVPSGIKFIKAFSIGNRDDLEGVTAFEGLCDYFLFDTPAAGYGGSGKMFDWELLEHYGGNTPFLLSGGIGPDSVEALRAFRHPLFAGIDVNSRFEVGPARKDIALLTEFVEKLQAAKWITGKMQP